MSDPASTSTLSASAFGLTMLVVGMGGTLLTLFLVTLLIRGLVTLFPVRKEKSAQQD